MSYLSLLSDKDFTMLGDWLQQAGELYLEFMYPHTGGNRNAWFVRSLEDLKELIGKQERPEIEICIYRDLRYPIRGVADDRLLDRALKAIPNGKYFDIVSLEQMYYPHSFSCVGSGNTQGELRTELSQFGGQSVAVGLCPVDWTCCDWRADQPEEILYLAVRRNHRDNPVHTS